MTGLFQIVVVIGVAFSYWINYGVTFMNPARGAVQWRIPIGFQLVPVRIMMFLLPLLKESPVGIILLCKDLVLTRVAMARDQAQRR